MGKYKIYRGQKPDGVWKIGCTKNYPQRCRIQKLTNYHILEEYNSKQEASDREKQLQIEYKYKEDTNSYTSVCDGTIGFTGRTHSKKTRKQISNKVKGVAKHSDEHKKMIGEMNAARVWKQESREKLSLHFRGNSQNMNEDKVRYIRNQYNTKMYTIKRIANVMGISPTQCQGIIRGTKWSWVK